MGASGWWRRGIRWGSAETPCTFGGERCSVGGRFSRGVRSAERGAFGGERCDRRVSGAELRIGRGLGVQSLWQSSAGWLRSVFPWRSSAGTAVQAVSTSSGSREVVGAQLHSICLSEFLAYDLVQRVLVNWSFVLD